MASPLKDDVAAEAVGEFESDAAAIVGGGADVGPDECGDTVDERGDLAVSATCVPRESDGGECDRINAKR